MPLLHGAEVAGDQIGPLAASAERSTTANSTPITPAMVPLRGSRDHAAVIRFVVRRKRVDPGPHQMHHVKTTPATPKPIQSGGPNSIRMPPTAVTAAAVHSLSLIHI